MPRRRRVSENNFGIDPVLTTEEAAKILRVKPRTVMMWLRNGQIPGFLAGKQWRISAVIIQKCLLGEIELKRGKNKKSKKGTRNKRQATKKALPKQGKGGVVVATKCEFVSEPTSIHRILGATEGPEAEALNRCLAKAEKKRKGIKRAMDPYDFRTI